VSRSFFAINISSLPTFREELARAQFCIDGTAGPLLGRAERSTPRSPEGRAGRREGLTAKARAKQQWCPGHYAANVTAFCVAVDYPLSALKWPITFGQLIQGGALFAMRHSPHRLISGRNRVRTKVPCIVARAQGLQGDGTHLPGGVLQPCD
jgi:hypothetical protein